MSVHLSSELRAARLVEQGAAFYVKFRNFQITKRGSLRVLAPIPVPMPNEQVEQNACASGRMRQLDSPPDSPKRRFLTPGFFSDENNRRKLPCVALVAHIT